MKINIAIAGGPSTGKSTLAAALFARLKEDGFDYDLITEEARKLKQSMGAGRSPFDRCYLWMQQEREEGRSMATEGFVTDTPLFHLYVKARQYEQDRRDRLAIRELLRRSIDLDDQYQLIVLARDPFEFPYKNDTTRAGSESHAREQHELIESFAMHFWPKKIMYVHGTVEQRVRDILAKLKEIRLQ